MYEAVELASDSWYPIEYKISQFLNFYKIAKEDIISINFSQNGHRATIIFYAEETSKYAQERDYDEV